MSVRVIKMFARYDGATINTCSSGQGWERELSPFLLGPCELYGGYTAKNVENAWQFSKVYHEHHKDGKPTEEYWKWAITGWNDLRAYRYPMGKGAIPLYSYWDGEHLNYIQARKRIYGPLYANAVLGTPAWHQLYQIYANNELYHQVHDIVLRDYDGYDTNDSLTNILNNPYKKMGHAFILKMLLTKDDALLEFVTGPHTPNLNQFLVNIHD